MLYPHQHNLYNMYQKIKNIDVSIKTLLKGVDEMALICTTDTKGNMIDINKNFIEASMFSKDELLGKTHRVVNSGYHDKKFFRNMWKTIGSGKIWRGHIRNKKKNGQYFWIDSMILPIPGKSGKPEQYVGICFEITDRKEFEERIIFMNKKLSQMYFMQESIIFSMSHDIKGPLSSIEGVINHFEKGHLSKEEFNSYIHLLKKDLNFSHNLLSHLVNWSNLKSFDFIKSNCREEIEITDIVQEIITYLKLNELITLKKLQLKISKQLDFGKNIVMIYILVYHFFFQISSYMEVIRNVSLEIYDKDKFLYLNLSCLISESMSFNSEFSVDQSNKHIFIMTLVNKKGGRLLKHNIRTDKMELSICFPLLARSNN